MKKPLLLACLLACTFPVFAQYEYLAVAGVSAGFSALKGHPQKPDEYVTQVSYQGRTFPQKRTPANKVPGKGGPQITAIEQLLASCSIALQAGGTAPVLSGRDVALTTALAELQTARPLWSTTAYAAELNFYRGEDSRRQYTRDEQARKMAYQRQQREGSRRDSLERLTMRRTHLIDSTRQAVLAEVEARQDSVARAQTSARQALEDEGIRLEAAEARIPTASPTRPSVTHHAAGRKLVVKMKRSTGPTVYYCASGNTVKYHATSGCRGLARCGASILPMSLREAEASMEPCKWCY